MPPVRLGIISSYFSPALLQVSEQRTIDTPWGAAPVQLGTLGGQPVAFIQRYGPQITTPSHRLNYRANIWALKELGVERIISQNAIGSINPSLRPGDIVVPHDFIDYTKQRPSTFFDSDDCWCRVDMTEPFCPELRQALIKGTQKVSGQVHEKGVFVCFEGPRLETPAEIRMFQMLGGDIAGTPLVPEVILAREAEICFASLSVIINYGTGLAPAVIHTGPGSLDEFYYRSGLQEMVETAIVEAINLIPLERNCSCGRALQQALKGTPPPWLKGKSSLG
ncbi:MAG: MTAP family purine nucleoside phosphorylase [Chloroflexi bacterium]|nr:MTAP family purine nucleoside phosphorylase [Chloroflexota bacterium]MCL5075858.1 MTAP family purine nucleoside phosphorylase [Chloroflexota bacterium]